MVHVKAPSTKPMTIDAATSLRIVEISANSFIVASVRIE
jgi:hypothetical protein